MVYSMRKKRKYLILTILLSMLFATAYSAPRRQIMMFREARLMEPRVVDFIKDVVIPVAKSADFRSDEDEIYVRILCASDTEVVIDIALYKGAGAIYWNDTIDLGEEMQYLTYIDDVPIFLSSDKSTPLIDVQKNERKLSIGVYLMQSNENCIIWSFILRNDVLTFDNIYHFDSSLITDKLYRSLLPPEIRIKKLDYIAPRIPLPAVGEKPGEAVMIENKFQPQRKGGKQR